MGNQLEMKAAEARVDRTASCGRRHTVPMNGLLLSTTMGHGHGSLSGDIFGRTEGDTRA
jgi:hypothetical protein